MIIRLRYEENEGYGLWKMCGEQLRAKTCRLYLRTAGRPALAVQKDICAMCTRKPPFCRLLQFRDMSIETNHVRMLPLVTSAWVPLLWARRVEDCKLCISQVLLVPAVSSSNSKRQPLITDRQEALHSHINQSSFDCITVPSFPHCSNHMTTVTSSLLGDLHSLIKTPCDIPYSSSYCQL
jgi:hypothetical protein